MVDFLIQSITKSSKNGDDFLKNLCPDVYYTTFKKLQILHVLNSPETKLWVVDRNEKIRKVEDLAKEQDNIIFAFLITQGDTLYYTYTKRTLRRKDYFWDMLKESKILKDNVLKVSNMTKSFFHLCQHKKVKLEYRPKINV